MRRRFPARTDCRAGALILLASACAFGQSTAFEVASVKPNLSGDNRSSTSSSHGALTIRNVPLKQIIERAYEVKDYSLSGPDWLSSAKFDIVAKPPAGAAEDQLAPMLQSLLAERFKLAVHRESKIVTGYALVVVRSEPKLQPVEGSGHSSANSGRGKLTADKISMAKLADVLAREVDRPVVDMTDLKGFFSFTLEWSNERLPDSSAPSIFTAVQEQLGLKFQPRKVPLEILVVDSAEKNPTEN